MRFLGYLGTGLHSVASRCATPCSSRGRSGESALQDYVRAVSRQGTVWFCGLLSQHERLVFGRAAGLGRPTALTLSSFPRYTHNGIPLARLNAANEARRVEATEVDALAGNGNGAVVAPWSAARPAPRPEGQPEASLGLARGLGAFREAHRITGSRTFWLCSRVHKVWRSEEWAGQFASFCAPPRAAAPRVFEIRLPFVSRLGPRRPPRHIALGSAAPLAGCSCKGWDGMARSGHGRHGIAKVRHGGALRSSDYTPAEVVSVM